MLITLLRWSLCSGGTDDKYHDTIWMFDAVKDEWEEVGRMKEAKYYHAVSTVAVSDVIKYCWTLRSIV